MNDVVVLNPEQKELLEGFIQRVVEATRAINQLKEDIKEYKSSVNDDILNLTQKTNLDKKLLNQIAKVVAEPDKANEQKEINEMAEYILNLLTKK